MKYKDRKTKHSYNSFNNMAKNNLFGIDYFDDVKEEFSAELTNGNKRDLDKTKKALNRVHKPKQDSHIINNSDN